MRTAALVATAELLRAIPAPLLAGAMLRSDESQSEALFAGRLQLLQEQLQSEYEACAGDDPHKTLLGGCLALQAELATQAMASLEADSAALAGPSLHVDGLQSQDILLPPW